MAEVLPRTTCSSSTSRNPASSNRSPPLRTPRSGKASRPTRCPNRALGKNSSLTPNLAGLLFGVVDLGALQAVTVVNVDGLPLGVEIQCCFARLTMAVAGVLDSAEGQMRFGADRGRVDVHNSSL